MQELVLTPSECVALVNQTLEIAYPTVLVEGEVGSFNYSRGKYVFFDLKDEDATLGCFMMAWQLKIPLEDGMRVKVLAEPRLTRWGKFSLTIRQVMPVGEGSIKKAFALLKAKLEAEGLLDETRKRTLPRIPRRIGVIASVESAGYADFMKIVHARFGGLEIEVANVQVQGMPAIEQHIAAIAHFNQQAEPVEVLVVIRGGGSADDLAAYNDELLVRAIATSRIPTMVGVGHEVDVSLADLVADKRAATPSNAAQLIVPDRRELLAELTHASARLTHSMDKRMEKYNQFVTNAGRHMAQAVDFGQIRLRLLHSKDRLHTKEHLVMERRQEKVLQMKRMLASFNPRSVLKRGYAVVRDQNGTYQTSGQKLHPGDMIEIEMSDAILKSEVHHVRSKK